MGAGVELKLKGGDPKSLGNIVCLTAHDCYSIQKATRNMLEAICISEHLAHGSCQTPELGYNH